jgi:hypothetical protein
MVQVFHEILGGSRHYRNQPPIVREICKGLKSTLINRKFRTAGDIRGFLDNYPWQE